MTKKFARVAVLLAGGAGQDFFDYQNNLDAHPGDLVRVPFGRRTATGVVADLQSQCAFPAKPLLEKLPASLPSPLLETILASATDFWGQPAQFFKAALPKNIGAGKIPEIAEKWVRQIDKNFVPRGAKQRALLEKMASGEKPLAEIQTEFSRAVWDNLCKKNVLEIFTKRPAKTKWKPPVLPQLAPEQQAALEQIRAEAAPHLLFGITGSGKTEIYLQLTADALAAGKSALILVPEIALTPQIIGRFAEFFPDELAVLHSRRADGQRAQSWAEIARGQKRVVLGTRSAIWAPIAKLGVLILDEYHDESYSQQTRPFYDARQVAEKLAAEHTCPLVFGSATPRVEDFYLSK